MISALLRDTQVPKYLFKHQCGYAVKVVVDEISGLWGKLSSRLPFSLQPVMAPLQLVDAERGTQGQEQLAVRDLCEHVEKQTSQKRASVRQLP